MRRKRYGLYDKGNARTYNGGMTSADSLDLNEYCLSGGRVVQTGPAAWRLELPAGPGGSYRLAQLDDYRKLARRAFPWRPPVTLSMKARASAKSLPGTWGYGLWNDPFGMGVAQGGGLRLPALPNAAWFFFASPPNYLSLRDDLPAQGALAATFRSPRWPSPLLLLGAPLLLDDYRKLARRAFPWRPPVTLSMKARASAKSLPGTWGCGLWNDPFGMGVAQGGGLRLPALPNAAWFFFASPPNYLSLRDDLPAQGALAATFRSPRWPSPLFLLGAPLLPLSLLPPAMRWLRRWARRIVRQDAVDLPVDPTEWHDYALEWGPELVTFRLDGEALLATEIVPAGPLGLVLWVDNQYAALPPDGRLRYGTLSNPQPAWIEIEIAAA